MSTKTLHGQMNVIDDNGNIQKLHAETSGKDVIINPSTNTQEAIPSDVDTIQKLTDNIGSLAFKSGVSKLETARTIDGVSFDGSANIIHYGTCSTAAATAAKTVAVTGFKLATGSRVIVKFTVTNSATSPTLNVNSTGAKNIYYKNAAISASYLKANYVYEFVYDGTNYVLVGEINTNTDTNVTQTVTTTNANYPILASATADATSTATTTARFASGVSINPSTKSITATTFIGALNGTATKATQDASGNTITSTYETKTDAADKLEAAKEYADNAAAKVKDDLLNGAGAAYDTLGELGDLIDENTDAIEALNQVAAGKQNTITGAASTVTSSNLTNSRALMSNSSGKIAVSDVSSTELGYLKGVTSAIQTQLDAKSDNGHTHNYAGSASAGGSANSAVKLDTATAGSATQPVYFTGGKPVATTYTLGKSVPSDAKFTDTTYGIATESANGLMSSADKSKVNYTNITYGTCSTAADTAAKEIVISGNTKWALTAGSRITIKFTNTNTAASPTLNVNSTGAKAIVYHNTAVTAGYLVANGVYEFVYDGTNYEVVSDVVTVKTWTTSDGTA